MFKIRRILKTTPCIIAITLYLLHLNTWHFLRALNTPRLWRQRNVISKVDEFSKMISFDDINKKLESFSMALRLFKKPPYIIFYDSSNIEITHNHICNLQRFPNTLNRLALVAFDKKSNEIMAEKYPKIPNVLIDLEGIRNMMPNDLENRKYIFYQIVLLTRVRICGALASRNIDFWAMQQDTLWIENFEDMQLEDKYPDALLLFDTVGNYFIPEYEKMRGWICGSTFFVRGNPTTLQFFQQIDILMRTKQSPDSSIMTYLCGHQNYKCSRLPRWIISSSDYFFGPRQFVPVLIQVDTDSRKYSKIEVFKKSNFLFRTKNGTCDQNIVMNLRDSVQNALLDKFQTNVDYDKKLYDSWIHCFKTFFNKDPYNNKIFLTVHHDFI